MLGTTFGIGLPFAYPTPQLGPSPFAPYGTQGIGASPFGGQQSAQPLQQVLHILQVVPHQLQQLQPKQAGEHRHSDSDADIACTRGGPQGS